MVVWNTGGVFLDTIAYRTRSVEFDVPTALTTSKLNEVTGNMNVENERWHVTLSVAGDKTISIQSMTDSPVSVNGTGKYVENGDSWGGTPEKPTSRDAIYLNYSCTRTDGNICEVHDTLVFRDRGIKVEEARPTIK